MMRTRTTEIVRDLASALLPLLVAGGATWWRLRLPASYLLYTVGLYGLLGALLLRHAPDDLPGRGLGSGSRVTLRRAALVLPVTALVMHRPALTEAGLWWVIGISTLALLLDGLDGWVARRTRSASAFGARFDMELDAWLLLSLSLLVSQTGKVGAWVLLVGLLRYLFLAAGWIWPVLRGELPASVRRKAICVVQGVALLLCLGPIVPPIAAIATAVGAVVSLVYSFGIDTIWLVTTAGTPAGSMRDGHPR